MRKIVSRDCSIRLPRVPSEDETQQSHGSFLLGMRARSRAWMRRLARATRHTEPRRQIRATPDDQLGVHATLCALPTLLDSSSLPNGVVELLIEDFEMPTRQVFDIHDGHVALVEPAHASPGRASPVPPQPG
jgi:hypothetical protein